MSGKRWNKVVGVLFILLGCHGLSLFAQGSIDCSDPVFNSSVYCKGLMDAPRATVPDDQRQVPPPDSTLGNRRDTSNQVYVDSAGTDQNRQTAESARLNDRFPPDPITDLQRLAKATTGEMLSIFGRDLFQGAPSTFAPGNQIPVPSNYVVGPGDQILLRVWGHDQLNSQLTVDTSGAIYIPQVGSVHVAGFRMDELQDRIKTQLSHSLRNFDLSVNLGRLRSIQVYVVGEARRPGSLMVSSLSTVLSALFASGGPNVQGSLRNIQIRRQNQPPLSFDLYDLALHGDKSKDIRLEPGDVVFIPPVGQQVALAGSVRHPAIYEMKDGTTLQNLLNNAGGFSSTASKASVELDRIEMGQVRKAVNINLNVDSLAMVLHDGDVLYAGHITSAFEQSVTIRGNLANPGRFSWHQGMRLSEVIPDRRSLLTNDYWQERNRLGVPVPLFVPLTPVERRRIYTANGISSIAETNRYPSTYDQFLDSEDLIRADQNNRQATPSSDADRTATRPREELLGAPETTLGRGSLAEQQESVSTQNLAMRAQRIDIKIPAPEIDWSYAVIERLDADTLRNSLLPFNLGKLVKDHDASQDLELKAGDVITILSQEDIHVGLDDQTKYVRLEGEFISSGVYSVHPGETLAELVGRAGGLTNKAYLFGGSFTRESARILQQQRLDEYVNALSIDLERSAAVRAASSTSNVFDPNAIAQQRTLIAQLKQLRATGRVVLEFRPLSTGVASIPEIPLENGDIFRVPSNPHTVSVIGAVNGQNVFLYDPKRKVQDYLLLAGNPNRIADRNHAFIIRADGSIFSRERAQGILSNNFHVADVNPGDSIVIPEKLIKPSAIRQIIDYSQIFSSFALGAAAVNVIR